MKVAVYWNLHRQCWSINRITAKMQEVTYNPYKHECFVMKGMGEPIFDSLEAYLTPSKKVYAIYW